MGTLAFSIIPELTALIQVNYTYPIQSIQNKVYSDNDIWVGVYIKIYY